MADDKINPIVARAIEHFRELERNEIEVPEWGEEDAPLTVYGSPLTMAERRRIQKQNPNDSYGQTCDIVILKAEDADGKRLFTKADKPYFLNKIDPKVIARIALALTGSETANDDLDAGIDDAGKD